MLNDHSTVIAEERSSKKSPITEDEVKQLLAGLATVKIARGKSIVTQAAAATQPNDLRGPTGNFRAPMLVRGDTLLVGFHPAALEELL